MPARELTINGKAFSLIGAGCVVKRVEAANGHDAPALSDGGFPLLRLSAPTHTARPAGIAFGDALVRAVLGWRSEPQVAPSVVRLVAVLVVNLLRRPFAGHDGPDHTVGRIGPGTARPNSANAVTIPIDGCEGFLIGKSSIPHSRNAASGEALFGTGKPKKLPSIRVVTQKLSQIIGRDSGIHATQLLFQLAYGNIHNLAGVGNK